MAQSNPNPKSSRVATHRRFHMAPGRERRRVQKATDLMAPTNRLAEPIGQIQSVHPAVIALAAGLVVVFLLAITFFLTSDPASDLNLFGVVGFAVIFFTLTLGLASRAARDQRWGGAGERPTKQSLADFVEDDIEIATGAISGREALVQILVLPMTLAAGMVVIGLIFAAGL